MLLRLLLVLMVLNFTPAARATDVTRMAFFSDTLQRDVSYRVYIPSQRAANERFPVLYLLHGVDGSDADWPARSDVRQIAARYRMILVFPDGGTHGWYVDSVNEAHARMETFITKDLIREVDRRLPTTARREGRAIMGLSMGGHGAISLAAKHPNLFISASATSGILDLEAHPDSWQIADRLGPLDTHRENWRRNSVYNLAERFVDADVQLLFDCGIDDTVTGAIHDGRRVHARMAELGVPHVWREFPGAHTWEYWGARLPEHLQFHRAAMWMGATLSQSDEARSGVMLGAHRENAQLAIHPPNRPVMVVLSQYLYRHEAAFEQVLTDHHVISRTLFAELDGAAPTPLSREDAAVLSVLEPLAVDPRPAVIVFVPGAVLPWGMRPSNGEQPLEAAITAADVVAWKLRDRLPEAKLLIVARHHHPREGTQELGLTHDNTAARLYNTALAEIATRHGATIIDLNPTINDEHGYLRPEYTWEHRATDLNEEALIWLAELIKIALEGK